MGWHEYIDEPKYIVRWDEKWEKRKKEFKSKDELLEHISKIVDHANNISVSRE